MIPNPLINYTQVFNLLLPVGSLFVAAGLLGAFQRAGSVTEQMRAIIQITAAVAFLAYFDTAVQTGKEKVQSLVHDGLHAKPEELPVKFFKKLLSTPPTEEKGWLAKISNFGSELFHAGLALLIVVAAIVSMVCFFLAYLLQEFALEAGIGLSPIFIGFLLLPGTRSIGVQFLLYMLAIILFPLGWGIASLVSDSLLDIATANAPQMPDAEASLSFAMQNLFGAVLLAIWIILSTLTAPLAMLKAVTSGVHISSEGVRAIRNQLRS